MKEIRKLVLSKYIDATSKDYSKGTVSSWKSKALRDFKRQNGSKAERLKAYKKGYLTANLQKMGVSLEDREDYLDDRTLLAVTRSMGSLTFSLDDRILQRGYVIDDVDYLPEYYFQWFLRDDEIVFVDIIGRKSATVEDIISLLHEKQVLEAVQVGSNKGAVLARLEWKDDKTLLMDGIEVPVDKFIEIITEENEKGIIREAIPTADALNEALGSEDFFLRYTIMEVPAEKPEILSCDALINLPDEGQLIAKVDVETGKIVSDRFDENAVTSSCDWEEACGMAVEYAHNFVALEILQVYVKITNRGCVVDRARRLIRMPVDADKDSRLYKIIEERQQNLLNNPETPEQKKSMKDELLYKKYARKGFRKYMFSVWLGTVRDDKHWEGTTRAQKRWAWKRGFASYRIQQYGLTNENADQFLSDYEYAWVNRINNTYRLLVDDKLAMRYSLDEAKELMPKYYYFIANRLYKDDSLVIRDLPDLPEGYGCTMEDIFRLIREKGKLAFKANAGTHGDGFYKLEYVDGKYLVNEQESDEEEITELINDIKSTYCLSEIVEAHHQISEIYPNALSTIRVMVINRDIDNPVIEHAYMRIGSSKTGVTDNIGYGGICCYVDKDTGRYYGAQNVIDHVFHSCPIHPDTGVEIEGYIPNWDKVREGIIKTAKMIPQIEYMGYDIAITEDGFRIIEINTHQDLHKYPEYPESVRNYLKGKCHLKWERLYPGKPYGKK